MKINCNYMNTCYSNQTRKKGRLALVCFIIEFKQGCYCCCKVQACSTRRKMRDTLLFHLSRAMKVRGSLSLHEQVLLGCYRCWTTRRKMRAPASSFVPTGTLHLGFLARLTARLIPLSEVLYSFSFVFFF